MAEKSLVNDDAEMLGVEADEDVEEEAAVELELALELEDELPQPAASAATTRPSMDTRNRLNLITARSSHPRATSTHS
jgi:hypothetical protein